MNTCPTCGRTVASSRCWWCTLYAPQAGQAAPEPKRELEHVLAAEPVTAYRLWRVVAPQTVTLTPDVLRQMSAAFDAGRNPFAALLTHRLAPAAKGAAWVAPHEHAKCHALPDPTALWYGPGQLSATGSHAAPHAACSCGIWGVKDEAYLHEALGRYMRGGEPYAFGTVKLWGRWYEHQKGYRAEYAQPHEITLVNSTAGVAAELADAYRCTVTVGSEPEAAVEARAAWRIEQESLHLAQASLSGISSSAWNTYMQTLQAALAARQPGQPQPVEKKRRRRLLP